MVLHSGPEELLLTSGSPPGRQGKEWVLDETLKNIHKYLYGQEYHLRIDHSARTWLMDFKNLEGQTAR
jgi:hypothetical protein